MTRINRTKKVFLVNPLSLLVSTLLEVLEQANFASESVLREDSPNHRCDRSWSEGDGDKGHPGHPECQLLQSDCENVTEKQQLPIELPEKFYIQVASLHKVSGMDDEKEPIIGKPYKTQMVELVRKRGTGG